MSVMIRTRMGTAYTADGRRGEMGLEGSKPEGWHRAPPERPILEASNLQQQLGGSVGPKVTCVRAFAGVHIAMPLAFPSHQGLILPVARRWPAYFDGLA